MIRAFRLILLAAVVAFGLTSSAAEWASEEAGVLFHLPSDPAWAQISDPLSDLRLILERKDKSAAVAFTASRTKEGPRILDEDWVKRREQANKRMFSGNRDLRDDCRQKGIGRNGSGQPFLRTH